MAMKPITITEAKKIAESKGLKPGRVKGSNGIQFTKGDNSRLEIISWEEFEKLLKAKNLSVFESKGFLKIMNKS